MSYYRMTESLMMGEAIQALGRCREHDSGGPARRIAMLWILLVSATQGREIPDPACLARLSDVSQRQAASTWQYCIDHGILRKGRYGYTARAWMLDQGILGRYKRETGGDAFWAAMEEET